VTLVDPTVEGPPGPAKAIWVYDSSTPEPQKLGISLGYSPDTRDDLLIFVPELSYMIPLQVFDGNIGRALGATDLYYENIDCSGLAVSPLCPQCLKETIGLNLWGSDDPLSVPFPYWVSRAKTHTITAYSARDIGGSECIEIPEGYVVEGDEAIALSTEDIPFTLPATPPLRFVYE